MAYLVTARKWRPMVFEDVAGQTHITQTLRNAIATNRLSHSYIFSGPRGVGKTTTARILAKAINCLNPVEFNPDNKCELCSEISEGRSLNVFEIDGASNRGIDEIRNLREAVRYGPSKGKYKIYIIDEVHMLTKEAFNALLKTLEEPPPHVLFIFATTEVFKVPLTILSRCQRFDFRRISVEEIINRLRFIAKEENISIDEDALLIIAKRADGSLRDAQSIFDQVISYCGEKIVAKQIIDMLHIVDEEMYFKISDVIKSKEIKTALSLVDEIINRGFDVREILNGINEHFRNLLVTATTDSSHLIETSEFYKKRYQEESRFFSEGDLLRYIKVVSETEQAIKWSQQPRLKLEISLLQLIKMDSSIVIEQLLQQLNEIKSNINSGNQTEKENIQIKSKEPEQRFKETMKVSEPIQSFNPITKPVPVSVTSSTSTEQLINLASNVSVASLPQVNQDNTITTITIEDAAGKWRLLIDEARKQRIAIGTMLSETKLLETTNNKLCVGCPDSFHLDYLKSNREFLSELAKKIYGAKIKLEAVISSEKSISDQSSVQKIAEPQVSTPALSNQHPVIQALIREFGAEPID
jgi:DNA polymerase III subunit gamma/tau